MRLCVVVDNKARPPLNKAWGLSVYVEGPKRILFDAGPDPSTLIQNAKHLHIPLEVDHLVISHLHWDHVGGIKAVKAKEVHMPEPAEIENAKVHERGEWIEDFAGVTGAVTNGIKEQGLLVRGSSKNLLLLGCSHPGPVKMVKEAMLRLGERVNAILGGLHLLYKDEDEVKGIFEELRELGVEEIYPIHCSGERARRLGKEVLAGECIEI